MNEHEQRTRDAAGEALRVVGTPESVGVLETRLADLNNALIVQIARGAKARDSIIKLRNRVREYRTALKHAEHQLEQAHTYIRQLEQEHTAFKAGALLILDGLRPGSEC